MKYKRWKPSVQQLEYFNGVSNIASMIYFNHSMVGIEDNMVQLLETFF